MGEEDSRDEWQGTVQAIRQENSNMMKRLQSSMSSSQKKVCRGCFSLAASACDLRAMADIGCWREGR